MSNYGMAQTFNVGAGFKFKGARGPGGMRIEDRIGVQTPPEVIWSLVHDLDSWESWNPLYVKATGVVRIGELLTLTQALPGRSPRIIQPRVLEWVPNEQLHWRVTQFAGLAVSTGYIEIEKLTETACIVSVGELVGGFMAPFAVEPRPLRKGLHLMNEGLKAAAEEKWRVEGGAPTSEAG